MKRKWTRAHTLAAGVVLIVLTNAVALGGVMMNRSREPESRLTLTERELPLSYDSLTQRENSGIALRLDWRVLGEQAADLDYADYGSQPAWLDAARMVALGFDVPAGEPMAESSKRYARQLPRQALVVLEFDGPTWQKAVDRAQAAAERHATAAAANPGNELLADRAKSARAQVALERSASSRLFAVDAGLDAVVLRARYPDRSRYLILRATIRPNVIGSDESRQHLGGYLSEIAIDRINVPYTFRPQLIELRDAPRPSVGNRPPRYEVRLAIGQRLEPWIERLAPLPDPPAR